MSSVSERERIAHIVRRLSMGSHPDLVAQLSDTDTAIARSLELSGPAPIPPAMDPPPSLKASQPAQIASLIGWWVDQMRSSSRLVEERLTWFWHDHFATSLRKVRAPSLMRQQHATIRANATGSFADRLHAIAKDPAILIFLDGITNTAGTINENFGRECLELFTVGRDAGYTQDDVVAASRSFSGWVVNVAGTAASNRLTVLGIAPWAAGFIPGRRRHRGVLHRAGERRRPGAPHDDLRVRATPGRERQRYRPRHRQQSLPHRSQGQGWAIRGAADAHQARRHEQPRAHPDFRTLYATGLRWLGVQDTEPILGGRFDPVGALA